MKAPRTPASMSEAIAEWNARTEAEAMRAAAEQLDRSNLRDRGAMESRALLALAGLYADWLIATACGRDAVEACISAEGQSGYGSRNPGRSFGMLAGKITMLQAEADLDRMFFDDDALDERILCDVASYDVEGALREI
mgnify:CR=1 FL=1